MNTMCTPNSASLPGVAGACSWLFLHVCGGVRARVCAHVCVCVCVCVFVFALCCVC